jgi:gamma-glutamyltranspeptidase/glutathione hydrolase
MCPFAHALLWAGTILLGIVLSSASPAVPGARRSTSLPPLSGKRGGVATEVGQCSDIGVNIMKAGGSAADAIIASGLCVGTIAGYHSGIGGGGFMLVRFNNSGGGHQYEMVSSFG